MYEDALASCRYLTDSMHLPASLIAIFVHSLGGGVATDLGARVPAAAVVAEGAFTSVVDRGQERFPMFPVKLLATQRFACIGMNASVNVSKLFLNSRRTK